MKTLLLTLCALCCLTGAASAVSYDLSAVVTPEGSNFRYTYSMTETGAREGLLHLILPISVALEKPTFGPISQQLPETWDLLIYSPFNTSPVTPVIVYSGGWDFYGRAPNSGAAPMLWEISFLTQFPPQLSQYLIKSDPSFSQRGEILMPAYDLTAVPDSGSTLPLLLAGLVSCRWIKSRRLSHSR